MIPEKEREALMRLTMCAREECIMCKYHKECDFDYQYETATRCMNILADALRKTENSSEKANNSTISKMEQVDEPQTCSVNGRPYSECSSCEHFRCTADEPQTERSE